MGKWKGAFFPTFLVLLFMCAVISIYYFYGDGSSDFQSEEQINQYSKHSALEWNWGLSSLEKYPFKGDEMVLDLGSGDGKITQEIAKKVPRGQVVGLDSSPGMIHFATTHYPRSQHRNLQFLQGDATIYSFPEQFDLIVSLCTMHYIKNQKSVLERIKTSLVPGGRAILVMPLAYQYNLSTVSEQLREGKKWNGYFEQLAIPLRYYKTALEYEELVRKAGLHAVEINTSMVDDTFANREALLQWILSISSFAKVLPPEKKREFAEEVADLMLTECPPPQPDGSLILRSPKLEVYLSK